MREINLSKHKAVILAGGKGTRLYPITRETPKPLLLVKRKPIISYLVDLFYSQGVKDIAVLVNKDFKEDFEWWGKRYHPGKNIVFFEEKEPLGTFGGLFLLKKWLAGNPFFLTNGDELKKLDLLKMAELHDKIKPVGTIALVKVPNPQDYGVVVCESNLVKEFLEKPKNPPTNYVSSGLYLFSPEIFNYHPGPRFSMIEKDAFPKLTEEKKLAGFKFKGRWTDCGTWKRYEEALNKWR